MSQIHRKDLSKEELQQAVNNLVEENKQLEMKLDKIKQVIKEMNCYYPLDTISEIENILEQNN